jgi:tetraacyldisaccharide 4'-kinase
LARDIEIVVVDAKDPLAKGRFLPRGRLRDLPSRLRAADLIIANHLADPSRETELRDALAKYTDAPIVGVYVEPLETEVVKNQRVGVFCGIGSPERFLETIRALDAHIVDTLFLLDHCAPGLEQLRRFIDGCQKKGATRILCTEKDAVKLSASFEGALPILPVKVQLEISCGQQHWDACLARIADQIKRNRISS